MCNIQIRQQFINMKEQQDKWRKYKNRDYRGFLATFKTQPCPCSDSHYIEYCQYYHEDLNNAHNQNALTLNYQNVQYNAIFRDQRRKPYNSLNQFQYLGQMCNIQGKNCEEISCRKCHNLWEYNYHPDNFKTNNCQSFYDCQYQFCDKLHYCDYIINQKTQMTTYVFSEFFRFNLDTFKTKPCKKQYSHEKSSCFYYHSQKDYRRPHFQKYQHTECPIMQKIGSCNENCPYSHNKIQQLYHPRRYKSKFCEKHYISRKSSANPNDETTFKSLCPFNKLCSFAHNDQQITITLIDKLPRNLEFYLYMYKTVWCPQTTDHNRSQCVYAHNIQDFRRNPKQKHYLPIQCPYWKKNQNIKCLDDAGCPNGLDCDKCHGWKQKQYHPIIYLKIQSDKSDGQTSHDVKSRTDSDPKKQIHNFSEINQQLVSKKLEASNRNNNLEKIVQKQLQLGNKLQSKQQIYLPGTPFFKNNKQTIKNKTQSQRGDSVTKEQTDEKLSQLEERGSFMTTTKSIQMRSGISYMNIHNGSDKINDQEIFKVFSGYNESPKQQDNQKRTVSRSLGQRRQKSRNFYSKDITQLLSPKVVEILRENNISQIKLINMKEHQIRKIKQLTNSQKNLIIKKIIQTKDIQENSPTYEQSLIKFFAKYKKDKILSKMKVKKVKQEKLLLLDSQIYDLSFLTENQKKQLPELLRQVTNNRDFQSLNLDITKTIKEEVQHDQQ